MWRFVLLISVFGVFCKPLQEDAKLIVIMIDGCRWDYIDDPKLKGFPKMAKYGVRAEYVKPVFPTSSYPNQYSIVTGLYSESHGLVHNILYDEELEEFFLMVPNPNSTDPHWWEKAEPAWVNAVKHGVKTAMYWWAGCEVKIHGVTPTLCLDHRYTSGGPRVAAEIKSKLGEVINDFHKDKIRFAMVYYGAVDKNGHEFGPDSDERKRAFYEIDDILDDLQEQISQRGLANQVNIMVVSDHGMTSTDPNVVNQIDLESFAPDIKYMLYKGSSAMILPEEGKLDKLYNDLKAANIEGLQIFKKQDIPERLHFKNNRLVLPLFLLAHKGYFIKGLSDYNKTMSSSTSIPRGSHGYDLDEVDDMRTIFYARGPALRKEFLSPPLENVDHYNMMCKILGIKPLPNNGSWDRIRDMFYESHSSQIKDGNSGSTVHLSVLMFLLIGASWWVKWTS